MDENGTQTVDVLQAEITRLKAELAEIRLTDCWWCDFCKTRLCGDRASHDKMHAQEDTTANKRVAAIEKQLSEARKALEAVDAHLATGFILCEKCGEQEDTADMDVRIIIRAALAAPTP